MNSDSIHKLYEFLDCSSVDGGVSGRGYYVIVSLETIKLALAKVFNSDFNEEDEFDYIDFLSKLQTYCKDNKQEGVIIHFS